MFFQLKIADNFLKIYLPLFYFDNLNDSNLAHNFSMSISIELYENWF